MANGDTNGWLRGAAAALAVAFVGAVGLSLLRVERIDANQSQIERRLQIIETKIDALLAKNPAAAEKWYESPAAIALRNEYVPGHSRQPGAEG